MSTRVCVRAALPQTIKNARRTNELPFQTVSDIKRYFLFKNSGIQTYWIFNKHATLIKNRYATFVN
jgi:hypothetical protein